MTPEQWSKFCSVFHRIVSVPPGARDDEIARAFDGDPKLERHLRELLAAEAANRREGSLRPRVLGGSLARAAPGASPDVKLEAGHTLRGRYRILRHLGAGGMGAVFKAADARFGRIVAIKATAVASPPLLEAIEREGELLASLRHPSLPAVSHSFAEAGLHFLVMDYVPGHSLDELLARRLEGSGCPFSCEEVLSWGDALLDALEFLHGQEPAVIHRDIKPHNLKLTPRGEVVLLDFGLAKGAGLNTVDGLAAGSILGFTPRYAPPEQMRGTGTDARSDVYALGATLFQLLTGELPPDAVTRALAVGGGGHDPCRRADDLVRSVPRAVADALVKAMALDPSARFPSARAFRQALERAQAARADTDAAVVDDSSAARDSPTACSVASLVVLPFPGFGETEDFPRIVEGLCEGLVDSLAEATHVRVLRMPAGSGEDPSGADYATLAASGWEAVILCRADEIGPRLALEVEAVRARDGWRLWGSEYNVGPDGLARLVADVTGDLVDALGMKRAASAGRREARRTDVPEAYLLYLKSRGFAETRTYAGLSRAIACAEEAAALDRGFALAHATIAEAHVTLASYLVAPPAANVPKALEAAERALTLAPENAEALAAAGFALLQFYFDPASAERYVRAAVRRRPSYVQANRYLTAILLAAGRLEESVHQAAHGVALEPSSAIGMAHLAWAHYFCRDYEHSLELSHEVMLLDQMFWRGPWTAAQCYIKLGRAEVAVEAAAEARRLNDLPITAVVHAYALARAGKVAEAGAIAASLAERAACSYVDPYLLAQLHAGLADSAAAIHQLEAALASRVWMALLTPIDPLFDDLRSDPSASDPDSPLRKRPNPIPRPFAFRFPVP